MATQADGAENVQSREIAPIVVGTGVQLPERYDYKQFESAEQYLEFIGATGVATLDGSDEFGDGFTLVKDKDSLVGIPLLIVEFQFNVGDYGDFVAVRAFRMDNNEKIVLIDGSTGIRDQVARWVEHVTGAKYETGRTYIQPIRLKRGLVRSEYDYTDGKGKTSKAVTHYFA